MESYHWFLLGIMVALTPSFLVLGVLLARSNDSDPHYSADETGDESRMNESYRTDQVAAAPHRRAPPLHRFSLNKRDRVL